VGVVLGNDDHPILRIAINKKRKLFDLHRCPLVIGEYAFIGHEGSTFGRLEPLEAQGPPDGVLHFPELGEKPPELFPVETLLDSHTLTLGERKCKPSPNHIPITSCRIFQRESKN